MTLSLFIALSYLFTPATPRGEPTLPPFAVAEGPVPVYSSQRFQESIGSPLQLTKNRLYLGQLFTAFPGTVFRVRGRVRGPWSLVYRVTTREYPCPATGCWLDARLVTVRRERPPEREVRMPDVKTILSRLEGLEKKHLRYCWGCNFPGGVPNNLALYGQDRVTASSHIWLMAGGDCSGILYWATDGATPRNTAEMLSYGRGVPVKGLSAAHLAQRLKPLDLVVWQGHVLIVVGGGQILEAINLHKKKRVQRIMRTAAVDRLWDIMRRMRPVNNYYRDPLPVKKKFVVRRWHPGIK